MPADPTLSSVHFRVQSAGTAVENALDALSARPVARIFQAKVSLNHAVGELSRAADYLRESGAHPNLLAYLEKLAAFYRAASNKTMRPASAPAVAAELRTAQGHLVSADPYGPAAPSG